MYPPLCPNNSVSPAVQWQKGERNHSTTETGFPYSFRLRQEPHSLPNLRHHFFLHSSHGINLSPTHIGFCHYHNRDFFNPTYVALQQGRSLFSLVAPPPPPPPSLSLSLSLSLGQNYFQFVLRNNIVRDCFHSIPEWYVILQQSHFLEKGTKGL